MTLRRPRGRTFGLSALAWDALTALAWLAVLLLAAWWFVGGLR